MDYILVTSATLLLAFEFAFSKKYQALEGVSMSAGLRFNALSGLLSALFMWVLAGFRLEWSAFSCVLALSMSLCAMSYSLLSFQVLKTGGMALYSTFLMSGGMMLPYVFGVLFLNEPITTARLMGLLAVLLGVILSNFNWNKINKKLLLLCCVVFLLNGLVSILSKCHQITHTYPTVSSASFAMYSGLGKLLFSTIALACCKPVHVTMQRKGSLGVVAGAAVIGGLSYLLQLIGARTLPATALYPIVTGGSIIFSAISGKVFFKEKLSRQQIYGIVFCFIGTLLFL